MCANALTMLLARLARGRYVVSVQNPLAMSEHGEPQPEHVLVRDPPTGRLSTPRTPSWWVADTTLAYDRRNIKLPRYAAADVLEVWLLNLQNDTIEVNSEPESERYRKTAHHRRGQRVISATLPGLAFDADEVIPPRETKPER